MSKIIGIDLGTTNSVVAVMEGGEPKVIINSTGNRTTPSVVGFTDKGDRLVGQPARHQQVTNPENTVFSIKRFMGRRHDEVEQEEKLVPYQVEGSGDDLVKVNVRGNTLSAPEISAMILQDLKKTAEDYLGETVERAVITVPAYFNDSQRQATKDAGEVAGLKVDRIINEPTAAALAYGLEKKTNQRIAVFDLGGGTFDVSILDVGDGVFEVLATNGDGHLGGDDFDQRLIDYLADEFRKSEGIDIRQDAMALQRLKEAAEKAKIELSQQLETSVNLPFITADQAGPKHLQVTVTRAKFNELCEDLFDRLRIPCETALKDGGLSPSDVAEIVMVGGSTRIPRVQEIALDIFKTDSLDKSINPDEVVAIGAAIQGGVLQGDVKDVLLLDVTPLSLGVETLGGVMTKLIEKNTTIPTRKSEIFSTAADNQPAVDVHVLQGERELARDNKTIGRFSLRDIPPAPRGTPQIEVTFDIDANGILNVSAKDLGTNKEQKITITASSGLSKEEIERMTKDAEAHADDDKKRREEIEVKNQADNIVYQSEKLLADNGDKIPDDVKGQIQPAIDDLKGAMDGGDTEAIKAKMDALQTAVQAASEHIYKAASEAAGAEADSDVESDSSKEEASKSTKDDVVIDAEVVEEDKKD